MRGWDGQREYGAVKLRSSAAAYLAEPPDQVGEPLVTTRPQELPVSSLTPRNFERLCYRMARKTGKVKLHLCRMYGVPGQSQQGVDIVLRSDSGYQVIQCKQREGGISGREVSAAVGEFLAGEWADRATRFILATGALMDHTSLIEQVEVEEKRLEQIGVDLEVWDSAEISDRLKSDRSLVEDFFGAQAADVFLGPPTRWQRSIGGRRQRKGMSRLVVGAFLICGLGVTVYLSRPTPSITSQAASIVDEHRRNGYSVMTWMPQLHPNGGASLVLLSVPTALKLKNDDSAPEELIIYDNEAGYLRPKFGFKPIPVVHANASPLACAPEANRFTVPQSLDQPRDPGITDPIGGLNDREYLQMVGVDGSSSDDILGAVDQIEADQSFWPRPFIIAWDDTNKKYTIQALLSPTTTGMHSMTGTIPKPTGFYANYLNQCIYSKPTPIRNADDLSSPLLEAYAPETYLLKRLPNDLSGDHASHVLLQAAYAIAGRALATIDTVEIINWTLTVPRNGQPITARPVPFTDIPIGANSSRIDQVLEQNLSN